MTKLKEQATTSLSPAEAFAYIAEFENIDQWDPGVEESVKGTSGETGVGSVYNLVLNYRGRNLTMQYVVTEWEPDKRVVLVGTGGPVKAVDTITFEPSGEGTVVTYEADLQLAGVARLFQPLMGSRFAAIGEAAGEGLRRWLGELEMQTRS